MSNFEKELSKISRLLKEAPLNDFSLEGDWGDRAPTGSFDKKSRKLLQSDSTVKKYTNFFKKLDEDINIYFLRISGGGNFLETGFVDPSFVREKLGWENYEENEDAINVIYTNNLGDQKVPLTPWIAAHRLGHSLWFSGIRGNDHGYKVIREELDRTLLNILNAYSEGYGGPTHYNIMDFNQTYATRLLGKIGTFRSARTDKISRPYEFIFEGLAQYINSGKVKFNFPPEPFSYDRRTFKFDEERFDAGPYTYSNTLEYHYNDLLMNSVGKTLVM